MTSIKIRDLTEITLPSDGDYFAALTDKDNNEVSIITKANLFAEYDAYNTKFDNLNIINVLDYGAVGDGITDDTTFIQAAIDACNAFDILEIPKFCKITDELILQKPLTIKMRVGNVTAPALTQPTNGGIYQATADKHAFLIRPDINKTYWNYYAGQYGMGHLRFENAYLKGVGSGSSTKAAIGVDTEYLANNLDTWEANAAYTTNDWVIPSSPDGNIYKCSTAGTSGVSEPSWDTTQGNTTNDNTAVWRAYSAGEWHLRNIVINDINIQGFQDGIDFSNVIQYICAIYNPEITACINGMKFGKDAYGDRGGQTDIFNPTILSCTNGIDASQRFTEGKIFGGRVSENSTLGLKISKEINFISIGTQFESNGTYNVYCTNTTLGNPNTDTVKKFVGCKFNSGTTYDFYLEDNAYGWSSDLQVPVIFDSCEMYNDIRLDSAISRNSVRIINHSNYNFTANYPTLSNGGGNYLTKLYVNAKGYLTSDNLPIIVNERSTGGANNYWYTFALANNATLNIWAVDRRSYTSTAVGSADLKIYEGANLLKDYFGSGRSTGTATPDFTYQNTSGSTQYITFRSNDGGSGNPYYAQVEYTIN